MHSGGRAGGGAAAGPAPCAGGPTSSLRFLRGRRHRRRRRLASAPSSIRAVSGTVRGFRRTAARRLSGSAANLPLRSPRCNDSPPLRRPPGEEVGGPSSGRTANTARPRPIASRKPYGAIFLTVEPSLLRDLSGNAGFQPARGCKAHHAPRARGQDARTPSRAPPPSPVRGNASQGVEPSSGPVGSYREPGPPVPHPRHQREPGSRCEGGRVARNGRPAGRDRPRSQATEPMSTTYLCGLDIGGTFTDCVLVDDRGRVVSAKAPSTPGDFAEGLMNALGIAARKCGRPVSELLADTSLISHGTTVGTNAIVQKRGARIGLVTTRGHNDVIHIMRGSRGLDGREVRQVVHIPESRKPTPIVPKRLIRGVSERVDCFGKVVVPLNEDQAAQAVRELLAEGVEAIAICFLWSFLEARARTPGQGPGAGPRAWPVRHLLPRAGPQVGRVRANDRLVPQRLRRAGDDELPRRRRGAARTRGIRRPAPDHPERGRDHPGRGRPALAPPHPRFRAGRGGHGLPPLGRSDGLRQRHHHRHGRHLVRHRGDPRRRAGLLVPEQGAPVRVLPSQGGHPGDRERGRQHGPDRRGDRHAPRRAGERGGRARAGLLRPGRGDAHGDGRGPRARAPQPRQLRGRRHAARSRGRPARDRRGRGPARHGRRCVRGRDHPDRRVPDGGPHPQGDDPEGLRPPGLRRVRVRRGGAGPRGGLRGGARRLQGGHSAAGHRVGVVRVRGGVGRPPPHLRAGGHHGLALRPRAG